MAESFRLRESLRPRIRNSDCTVSALREAGVPDVNIVGEKASGKAGTDRPRYDALLAKLADGDKLVVWKVDRLGRSTL